MGESHYQKFQGQFWLDCIQTQSWFLRAANIIKESSIPDYAWHADAAEMYSASVLLKDKQDCRFDDHKIGLLSTKTVPDIEQRVTLQFTKSLS